MTKKEWNNLSDKSKELLFKIAEERDCSLDEAYDYAMLVGGAYGLLMLALMS